MGFDDEEEFGHVGEATGEYARLDKLSGHLLLIYPIGYIEHSQTRFSTPGKRSDVIVCDVIDLDDKDDQGQPGKVYRNTWWRGAQLIMGLRPQINNKVLGRLGKGVARNGMNAPWVITDMATDAGCLEQARAWRRTHPTFMPNPFQQPQALPTPPPAPPQQQYAAPPQTTYPPQDYGRPDPYAQQDPYSRPAPYSRPEPYGEQGQPTPPTPRYPVERTYGPADADMLEAMRRQREERQRQPENPPF